jgi:peptidoglycan/LPS O-acetylase OafA/YrhL
MRSSGAPPMLRLVAAVLAVETAGLLVASVLTAIDTADGRSYQESSGIALTLIAFGSVAALALMTRAIVRLQSWSRTPTAIVQVLIAVVAFYLLGGHRYDWGVPAMALAIAGLAGLLAPSSIRALMPPSVKGGTPGRSV